MPPKPQPRIRYEADDRPHHPHDGTYRQIFGHQHMMAELIRGFFPSPLLEGWELDSLERKDTHWVGHDRRHRSADLLWRLRRRHTTPQETRQSGQVSSRARATRQRSAPENDTAWAYVYVLLELQSRPDERMALRILEYVTLLLHSLIDAREIPGAGPYPAILPVVLYNGRRRWRGKTSLRQCQSHLPQALLRFNPSIDFLLIDLNTLDPAHLQRLANACAVFFRMELQDDAQALPGLVARLDELLPAEQHATLRRVLVDWIREVFLPARGGRIDASLQQAQTLSEVHIMLAERVKDWFAQARREGRYEGREEGREEGRLAGQAELLAQQLHTRFGPELPAWVQARLGQATDQDLLRWARAVLDAESLEAVFGQEREPR
ncbi:Rpn family recombination-promoting nuclease/putative transposase [Verticiella sediminum]|nr:Rpn family recombination-promoting nuclease/putative transposase [Verticiella sediminum]